MTYFRQISGIAFKNYFLDRKYVSFSPIERCKKLGQTGLSKNSNCLDINGKKTEINITSKVHKAELRDLLNNPPFKKGEEIVNKITCTKLSTNQNAAKFEFTYNALVRIYCFYLQGWRFFSRYNRGGGLLIDPSFAQNL